MLRRTSRELGDRRSMAVRAAAFSTGRPGSRLLWLAVLVALTAPAWRAEAIPAFARKYGTACQTCHVIYPKLTPFGEAFRRNGFRFPGIDMDFIKQEQVPLGQEANKKTFPKTTWPGILPSSVPLAFGVNGSAIVHPDKNSSAATADNGTIFTLHDLVAEAHLWAGGSFSERITYFAELTFGSDGTLDLELASVLFNDFFGLRHALNLVVGRARSNITSFGAHSSYIADTLVPPLGVTAMWSGVGDSWNLLNPFNGFEINGMVKGRMYYALGLNAGTNSDIRPTENVYAHLGVKIGGMPLDGEGDYKQPNPERPWEETALTIDGFFYRSASHFMNSANNGQDDLALTFGGQIRAQWRSLELNTGVYQERHDHVLLDGTSVNALMQYNELSYVIFPWLVPALRVEYLRVDIGNGAGTAWDVKIIPGVAALVVQNLKLVLTAQVEMGRGAPPGGWLPANGFLLPSAFDKFVGEIENLQLTLAYAY